MPDEDEIVVELDPKDMAGGVDPPAPGADADKPPPSDDDAAAVLRGQVDKLKGELETSKRQLDGAIAGQSEAQARAEQAARAAQEARRAAVEESTRSRESRKQGIDAEASALENSLAVAHASQDYTQVAKLQRQMTALEVERRELDRGEPPATRSTEGRVVRDQQPPPQRMDMVEAMAAQLAPPAAAWIRAHPDYATDQNKNMRLKAHHTLVVADGFQANTPEYFAEIEKRLGMRKADGGDTAGAPPAAAQRGASPPPRPSAPARSADGVSMDNGGKAVVKLNASEQRTATDGTMVWNYGPLKGQPIGVKEYARRKALLAKDGRYETPYV
jgi:hypothetical protein